MGCAQSKIESEESVARCRDRKQQLRGAVVSRNAFAAAHSAYAVALKNTGAALSDYAHGESLHPHHLAHLHHLSHSASASASVASSSSSAAAPAAAAAAAVAGKVGGAGQPPVDALFPPPPPPAAPDFSPIQRSVSMPADLPLPKHPRKPAKDPLPPDSPIREEDEDEDEDEDGGEEDGHGEHDHGAEDEEDEEMEPRRANRRAAPVPPQPPPPQPQPKPAANPVATSGPGMETYDYFFGQEYTAPPPTLGQLDEQLPPSWPGPDRRDLDADRRPNKVSGAGDPVVTIAREKEAAPPRPPPANPAKKVKQGGGGGGGGPVHHQHAASAGAAVPMESSLKKGKAVAVASVAGQPGLNLVQLLNQLDDHFLHAFLSSHEVSKMLESTRMHYHSNFVDKRGRIDHSARVMKAITWNRSFKGLPQTDDANDDFDNDEWETHATILDKMLAWEKKLYDEVKAGELMKIEYQRKVALLNKQKKRGVRSEVLEKTKSAVSHLHTRYIVDMQSMDSTVSEINRLRDHQLYPKLVELVDGMGKMWGTMYEHHRSQLKIVTGLRAFDISLAPKETTEAHHERTIQLCEVVREWHSQFQKLMLHQKDYIKALNGWLKLNLIPIESSLKEKVSSPPRQADPPIKKLLHAWNDFLDKLPDELARAAINSFAEVIHNIEVYQQDELKSKHKCDETRKELDRKTRQFEDWRRKYTERRASMGEENTTEGGEGGNPDPAVERKIALEALEIRLKEEEENHRKQCKQVREKSLGSLRTHLPELFRALSEFSAAISVMYKKLWSITQSQDEDED